MITILTLVSFMLVMYGGWILSESKTMRPLLYILAGFIVAILADYLDPTIK